MHLVRSPGRVGNRKVGRAHPNYSIVKIHQNAEKIPGDLKRLAFTQTSVKDHQLTQVWKTCANQQKKRTGKIMDFAIPADYRVKLKESEKKNKYLDLARELKKLWNMKVTFIPIIIDARGTVAQGIDTRTGGFGNKRISWDYPNYCITEIGQNTEKSPRDLRRLAVTQTPVKDQQLTLLRKTLKE